MWIYTYIPPFAFMANNFTFTVVSLHFILKDDIRGQWSILQQRKHSHCQESLPAFFFLLSAILRRRIFFLWLYSPILCLGRLQETFRFISGTRSRRVGRTPWTGNQLVARHLLTAAGDCDDDDEVDGMNAFGRGNRSTRRNLPRRHFVHHKSHFPDPGANPGHRGGKPATNRFSYGAASYDADTG
jgi:hypothetical protein